MAVKLRVDATLGRELARKPAGDFLLLAEFLGQAAGHQAADDVVREAGFAPDGGVRIKLIVGTPDGADGENNDLPHPLAERGVGLLCVLQVQEGGCDAGAQHDRIERPDQPAIIRSGLEAGLIGPAYHRGEHAVIHRPLAVAE